MSRHKKLLALAAVIATAAILLAVPLFVGPSDDDGSASAEALSNRPTLSVCVQGSRGLTVTEGELGTVRQALTTLREQFGTEKSVQTEAASGCPPSRALETAAGLSTTEFLHVLFDPIGIRAPDLPSPNRLFVYTVPAAIFSEYFGAKRWVTAPAEMYCSGHSCAEVTTALYIPVDARQDTVFEGLKSALGLVDYPSSVPTPDLTVCVREDPPYWCAQFPKNMLPSP